MQREWLKTIEKKLSMKKRRSAEITRSPNEGDMIMLSFRTGSLSMFIIIMMLQPQLCSRNKNQNYTSLPEIMIIHLSRSWCLQPRRHFHWWRTQSRARRRRESREARPGGGASKAHSRWKPPLRATAIAQNIHYGSQSVNATSSIWLGRFVSCCSMHVSF